eukprot:614922-Prorocentrum_minimum.AAC.1
MAGGGGKGVGKEAMNQSQEGRQYIPACVQHQFDAEQGNVMRTPNMRCFPGMRFSATRQCVCSDALPSRVDVACSVLEGGAANVEAGGGAVHGGDDGAGEGAGGEVPSVAHAHAEAARSEGEGARRRAHGCESANS